MKPKTNGRLLLTGLFLFSGLSGLIYEVIWVRQFGLVFGNTVFASSTVLSVFMAGLALGSWLFGRFIDRRGQALRIYALLEAGIGIFGLLVPLLIQGASPLYTFVFRQFHPSFYQISLVRFVVSFLILIVPCTLMGGTLPVISKFITGAFAGTPEKLAGRLYAVNTFGAVLGSLVSGYFLIGTVGLIGTTVIAAFFNFAIVAAVYLYGKRHTETVAPKDPIASKHPEESSGVAFKQWQVMTVIALYALSGFLSLFLEVAWTRSLVWVMGMDAYAFASMLAVFLSGLALGSFIFARFVKNLRGAIMKLGLIELLIGISVIFSTVLLNNMYGLRQLFETSLTTDSFWGSSALLVALAAAVMALPALLMGMAFPLALKICLDGSKKVGTGVGKVYAANTIGSVFGALAAGFVSLPLIGVMRSILVAGGVFLLIAAVLFTVAREFRKISVNVASVALALVSLVAIFTAAPDFRNALAQGLSPDERLIYFKETVTGDVEVIESSSEGRILRIDGRQVASDGPTDLPSHLYPAHLVSLLENHPKTALFIAFGAGGTAGSILRYGDLERLDVVEICGGVVEPARQYFSSMNYGVLDDPRLHLIIQDGRNFVHLTGNTYDIIYSGPIHPQSNQGSAALYTRNFFQDCRKLLNKGGIQCIWLPMHMPPEDYKLIVKTFQKVYPHSSLWLTSNSTNTISHTHLIGSLDPLTIDYGQVSRKLQRSAVAADLGRMSDVSLANCMEFIGQYTLGEHGLQAFTAGVNRLNTDNRPTAEFFMKIGRKLYPKNRECPALLLTDMVRCRESAGACVVDIPDSERIGFEGRLADYCKGDSLRIQGHIANILCNVLLEKASPSKGDVQKAFRYYNEAYQDYGLAQQYFPNDRFLKQFMLEASRMKPQAD